MERTRIDNEIERIFFSLKKRVEEKSGKLLTTQSDFCLLTDNILKNIKWRCRCGVELETSDLGLSILDFVCFYCNIVHLKQIHEKVHSISYLDVSKTTTKIKELPLELNFCEYLNCSDQDLVEIPLYKKLRTLICRNNKSLIYIPSSESYETLDCSNCMITLLPIIKSCVNLNCSHNAITVLPYLPNCQVLDCSYNILEEVKVRGCTELYCSFNSIKKIKCPFLKILDCSNNCLEKLKDLLYIEVLSCSNNFLRTLPQRLLNCKHLFANNNRLKQIPYSNVYIDLDLRDNNIHFAPLPRLLFGNIKLNPSISGNSLFFKSLLKPISSREEYEDGEYYTYNMLYQLTKAENTKKIVQILEENGLDLQNIYVVRDRTLLLKYSESPEIIKIRNIMELPLRIPEKFHSFEPYRAYYVNYTTRKENHTYIATVFYMFFKFTKKHFKNGTGLLFHPVLCIIDF